MQAKNNALAVSTREDPIASVLCIIKSHFKKQLIGMFLTNVSQLVTIFKRF
jgi:hypothetical protein